jgi:hypothetical protein
LYAIQVTILSQLLLASRAEESHGFSPLLWTNNAGAAEGDGRLSGAEIFTDDWESYQKRSPLDQQWVAKCGARRIERSELSFPRPFN